MSIRTGLSTYIFPAVRIGTSDFTVDLDDCSNATSSTESVRIEESSSYTEGTSAEVQSWYIDVESSWWEEVVERKSTK